MDRDFWMLPWLRLNCFRRCNDPGLGYVLLSIKEYLGCDKAPDHPSLREVKGCVMTCTISPLQCKMTCNMWSLIYKFMLDPFTYPLIHRSMLLYLLYLYRYIQWFKMLLWWEYFSFLNKFLLHSLKSIISGYKCTKWCIMYYWQKMYNLNAL